MTSLSAQAISQRIKRKIRHRDLIAVRCGFDVLHGLQDAMRKTELQKSLNEQNLKDKASQYVFENGTTFSRHFIRRLPFIVREDVEYQIAKRLKRSNATRPNIERFINATIKNALKFSPLIENKFPFVDERRAGNEQSAIILANPDKKPLLLSNVKSPVVLDHHTLMSDKRLETLAENFVERCTRIIQGISIDEEHEQAYFNSLKSAFIAIAELFIQFHIKPPTVPTKHSNLEDAERDHEIALRRCLDADYIKRKFLFLRSQYVEYSQIALGRVGRKKGQSHYLSNRSLTRWKHKQAEAQNWLDMMAVYEPETGVAFDLAEVVKRTTANQENRRIELVVRTRGDEERAIDMGFVGVFLTWTLPSKYHRVSSKWNGCTVKEAHANIMEQWVLARAHLAKADIQWFGLRVAEPHKDGTPHAHMFLYVHPSQKAALIRICRAIAMSEDKEELNTSHARKARFLAKDCDPAKGSATGYIIKYISKNINGAHMPETDAEKSAQSVQAWASTHRIKQFSQSGSKPVGLWRQFRRAKPLDTAFDEELDGVREACDKSRWKAFCQLAGAEKLAYEEKRNKYGEITKRVIGIEWLGKVIETASAHYSLVRKKDVQRLQEERSSAPWSTENKCNPIPEKPISPLEKALIEITGWTLKGIQCLIKPLSLGATMQIDKHQAIKLRNNQLVVT